MKTRTDPRDESVLGKMSNRTRRIIEAIARSPFADKAVAEEEKAVIERRIALGTELAKADGAAVDDRLLSALLATRAGVEKAEQALKMAQQKFRDADNAVFAAQNDIERRRGALLLELHDSADERLWQFIAKVRGIITHDLSLALQFFMETKKNGLGYTERTYRSNVDSLTVARQACERVIAAADGARLEPLDYVEVSQRLMGWCEELAGPLGAVEVNPPSLTAEHAEVGPNMPWSGSPRWIREEPFRETRRQYLESVSARLKQKGFA